MAGPGIFKKKIHFKERFLRFVKNYYKAIFFVGFAAGIIITALSVKVVKYTSTDKYCESCHIHDHATASWKLSTHYGQYSGMTVHCTECHLPPGGMKYLTEKARTGIKDIWGYIFKDSADFNWELKSQIEHAQKFVYKESCIKCHSNLFPLDLSDLGANAHLAYLNNPEKTRCISCHIGVGHYNPDILHAKNVAFGAGDEENKEIYTEPAHPDKFENFTELIPNSTINFDMIAIPEGIFEIGSPKSEKLRNEDEGPVRKVKIRRFFMGKIEVSWNEYLAFFKQTGSEGKSETSTTSSTTKGKIDGITGATPPWGAPDQGWGKESRPAITMTHHAAMIYCQWLSKITGKKYRLPTEAEWEYACRGGTTTAYFFEGNPKKYTKERFWNKLFGVDTSTIAGYVVYSQNSNGKTEEPEQIKPNPFGLINMLGNVSEFCSDWYNSEIYNTYPADKIIVNPRGPQNGTERVIRGGSYRSDARYVRSASRDQTQHENWLTTDPQFPKSIWWYSDSKHVGFRVVCEADFIRQ